MNLSILYFASVKENLGCERESFEGEANTVAELIAHLQTRGDIWRSTLQENTVLVAVNQTISDSNAPLNPGDEVAFFPPVTGG